MIGEEQAANIAISCIDNSDWPVEKLSDTLIQDLLSEEEGMDVGVDTGCGNAWDLRPCSSCFGLEDRWPFNTSLAKLADGHMENESLDATEDTLFDLSKFLENLFEDVKDVQEVTSEDGCENEDQKSNGIKRKISLVDDLDSKFSPAIKYTKTSIKESGLIDTLSKETTEKNPDVIKYDLIEINGTLTVVHNIPPLLNSEQWYYPEHKEYDELEQKPVSRKDSQEMSNEQPSQSSKNTVPICSPKKIMSAEELQAERRRRNNDSSRRSRQSKRQKNKEMEGQVKILEKAKEERIAKIGKLTAEIKTYRDMLINCMIK